MGPAAHWEAPALRDHRSITKLSGLQFPHLYNENLGQTREAPGGTSRSTHARGRGAEAGPDSQHFLKWGTPSFRASPWSWPRGNNPGAQGLRQACPLSPAPNAGGPSIQTRMRTTGSPLPEPTKIDSNTSHISLRWIFLQNLPEKHVGIEAELNQNGGGSCEYPNVTASLGRITQLFL